MNIYTISFLFLLTFNVSKCQDSLHMLQQNQYNDSNNRYVRWLFDNPKSVFLSLDFISMIIILIAYFLNNSLSNTLILISLIFYLLDNARMINNRKVSRIKKPLVVTRRVKRLIFTLTILYLLPIVVYLNNKDEGLLLLVIESIITYFNYIMVLLAKFINRPSERFVYRYYYTKATMKLDGINDLKVVGVTGSYGKTSASTILNSVLSKKYNTRQTPRNLNSINGLMKTINNQLVKTDEIFIAEMGAYERNEINKLCGLAKPKYGILTYIGLTNIESYGNLENLKKTMFTLIDCLPDDGIAILNSDDPNQLSYEIKSKCKKIWIGINNKKADVIAKNIKCSYEGSKFDIVFKGDKTVYHFETKLLGNYNIYNILASIALAKELDIDIKDLVKIVSTIRPIKSRMELKDYKYMYELDDTYNSNPIGAKMALDVLETMPGVKLVVTPGMVDLGGKEKHYNRTFGSQIAKVADYVILIGAKRTRPIFDGLLENSFNKDKIFVVNHTNDAYALIQELKFKDKIYALFENDLSDIYK